MTHGIAREDVDVNQVSRGESASPPRRVALERAVRRELLAQPDLSFSSLVVRRTRDGVRLEGTVDTSDQGRDIPSIVQRVDGVTSVVNHLLIRPH